MAGDAVVRVENPQEIVYAASAAIGRGEYDLADPMLAEALNRWPDDAGLLNQYGWVAFYRGDMAEAARRWLTQIVLNGQDCSGWVGLSRSLANVGKLDLAEAVLDVASARLPDRRDILIGKAEMLSNRQDWRGALTAYNALKARDDVMSSSFDDRIGVALYHLQIEEEAEQQRDKALSPSIVPIVPISNLELRDFFMQFESLGENCEFGLVQRRFGAEPLGLLRWNTTEAEQLVAMLETGFARVGDPATVTIAADNSNEYYIDDKINGLHLHTFIKANQAEMGEVLAKQIKRIARLREIMADRLREGGKILVFKSARTDWPEAAERIFTALAPHGRNTLLTVHPANAENPSGTVRQSRPGLLHGFVDRLNPATHGGMISQWDIAFDAWEKVCRSAYEMAKAAHPSYPG